MISDIARALTGCDAVVIEQTGEYTFTLGFVGDEPGPGLVYLDANGTVYGPPDGYTKEDLLTALEGGKDTLPSIWTNLDELDIDPDILY